MVRPTTMMTRTYVDDKPSTSTDRTPKGEHPAARGEHPAAEQLEVSADLVAILPGLQRSNVHALPRRLTSPDPKPCGAFLHKFQEHSTNAGDAGVTVRSYMTLTVLADVCLLANFPDHRVRSITYHELLVCLQHVAQQSGSLSAVAIAARPQQAACAVPPPADANDVHQHVFSIWEAMREVMDITRSWGHFKVDGDMFGAWKQPAAKTCSRIMLESLQPYEFRESCRAVFVIDTSTLKDPSVLMKLIRDEGLRWPNIQWVLGADRRSRSSRRGTGCVAGDARNHRGGEVTTSASVTTNQYQSDRRTSGQFERCAQRTQVHRPKIFTSRGLVYCLSECARCLAELQHLPRFGFVPDTGIYMFYGTNVLLRRKQWLLPRLHCWRHLREAL